MKLFMKPCAFHAYVNVCLPNLVKIYNFHDESLAAELEEGSMCCIKKKK